MQTENTIAAATTYVDPTSYTDPIILDASFGSGKDVVLNIEVVNNSGQTINGCKVQVKDHPSGAFYDYFGETDFASTSDSRLEFCSTIQPNAATDGQTAHAKLRVGRPYAIRTGVKLAASTGNVVIRQSV